MYPVDSRQTRFSKDFVRSGGCWLVGDHRVITQFVWKFLLASSRFLALLIHLFGKLETKKPISMELRLYHTLIENVSGESIFVLFF